MGIVGAQLGFKAIKFKSIAADKDIMDATSTASHVTKRKESPVSLGDNPEQLQVPKPKRPKVKREKKAERITSPTLFKSEPWSEQLIATFGTLRDTISNAVQKKASILITWSSPCDGAYDLFENLTETLEKISDLEERTKEANALAQELRDQSRTITTPKALEEWLTEKNSEISRRYSPIPVLALPAQAPSPTYVEITI
jgi:hypothetical protein